jgi:hypothetical protein
MPLRQSFDPFEYGEQLLEAQVNPLDPVDWAHKKAGIDLWSKQRDIIRSIRDNRRTAVQIGHGIGKVLPLLLQHRGGWTRTRRTRPLL